MVLTSCTPEDLERAHSASWHCLTRAEYVGLTLTSLSGFLSLISVLSLFIILINGVIREREGKRLMQQPMDVYLLSLFAADLIQALGGVMNVKWIRQGMSETGPLCTAQGLIHQMGEVAVALTTIAMAFPVLCGGGLSTHRKAKFHAFEVVATLWLVVLLMAAAPAWIHRSPSNYYGVPTALGCTTAEWYKLGRLWTEYVSLWSAFVVSIVSYIPLACWSRGNITVVPNNRRTTMSMSTIVYPLSYAILTLPISVVRWVPLEGTRRITSIYSTAAATVFGFSGAVHVLILMLTRPDLLMFGQDEARCTVSQTWITSSVLELNRIHAIYERELGFREALIHQHLAMHMESVVEGKMKGNLYTSHPNAGIIADLDAQPALLRRISAIVAACSPELLAELRAWQQTAHFMACVDTALSYIKTTTTQDEVFDVMLSTIHNFPAPQGPAPAVPRPDDRDHAMDRRVFLDEPPMRALLSSLDERSSLVLDAAALRERSRLPLFPAEFASWDLETVALVK